MPDIDYPDAPPATDRITVVAYTLATRYRRSQHGQHCPVWAGRTRKTTIDTCNCWQLRDALSDADAVLDALRTWEAPSNARVTEPERNESVSQELP